MKHLRITAIAFLVALLGVPALGAQSLKGMSLNGSTGLYSIPSGRIGWEQTSNLGLDLGYHTIISEGTATHIPKFSLSLFKWVELSMAIDFQPDRHRFGHDRETDFVGGIKIQFPLTNTAIALGGNYQDLNLEHGDSHRFNAGQIYVAVTYAGQFFNMPAETTVVLGKTFIQNRTNWDIDFGMGFDLVLVPSVFQRYVHWIADFSNFSYSVEAFGANAYGRGVLNTGVRLDLAAIPALSKFKFVIDIMMTDAFDDNRAFSIGVVFGIPIL